MSFFLAWVVIRGYGEKASPGVRGDCAARTRVSLSHLELERERRFQDFKFDF
jgi:hypothetical protein